MNNETNAIKDTDRNVRANERARQINELRRLDTFNESLGNWNEMVESTVTKANKAIDESKTQTQSAQAAEAQRQSTFNTKLAEWDADAATHIAASEKATADANEAAENAKNVTDAAAANANTAASNAQSVANTIQRKLDNGEFKGADGKTPVRGVDYWTTADRAPIEQATSAANTAATNANNAASNANTAANHAEDVASSVSGEIAELKSTKADKKQTDRTEARLDIVEAILAEGDTGWTLDNQESYEHVIPANLIKVRDTTHGFVDLVGIEGNTVKWNQLARFRNADGYQNGGITFRSQGAGINIEGTATTDAAYCLIVPRAEISEGHKILFGSSENDAESGANFGLGFSSDKFRIQDQVNNYTVSVKSGATVNKTIIPVVVDLTTLFGAGNEPADLSDPRIEWVKRYAAEHPEYNPGQLVSADVRAVESVGKNLYIHEPAHYNIVYGGRDLDAETIGDLFTLKNGETYMFSCDNVIDAMLYVRTKVNGAWQSVTSGKNNVTFAVPANAERMNIWWYKSGATQEDYAKITNIQIERGTTATEYSPYGIKESIDLPALDLKSAGSVRDRADFLDDTVKRKVGVVDLGTLNWSSAGTVDDTHPYGWHAVWDFLPRTAGNINVACAEYTPMLQGFTVDKTLITASTTGGFYIVDSALTNATAAEFKAAMSGVLLYYALATPTEEPLTVSKSYIQAEPGGTIRFANADTMPVPHAVQYPVNRREALNA